jgi:hypothetical protein
MLVTLQVIMSDWPFLRIGQLDSTSTAIGVTLQEPVVFVTRCATDGVTLPPDVQTGLGSDLLTI